MATPGLVSRQFGNLQLQLRDVCASALDLNVFPRTLISVTVQELQNDSSFSAAATNACCLALLDAGLPISFVFCGVTVALDKDKQVLLDPCREDEKEAVALAHLVFKNGSNGHEMGVPEMIGCRTEGRFSVQWFRDANQLAKEAAKRIFAFYRDTVSMKYSREGEKG